MTKPCTRACCVSGIQFAVTRAHAGYRGAVTNPSTRRIRNNAGTIPITAPSPGLAPRIVMAVRAAEPPPIIMQRPARTQPIREPSTRDHQKRVA